ncbi:MAG: class SAM-dependent methyltransferase [Chloroflexi bacterium]|nr:class SAM-dependent methyltransferase [Chloroflexota bacterium]
MPADKIAAGGADWVENWAQLVRERDTRPTRAGTNVNAWDERAARFAQMAEDLDPESDPLVTTVARSLRPSDSLLDVGAGAGRYTMPLAPLVGRVTAVEPSAGMRGALERGVAARSLANVTVIPASWQDAAVDSHDVVLVANVIQMIEDVVPFIEKLDATARRACYLFIRVEPREAALAPLWRQVWGSEPLREPNFLDLYNLLFSLGIRPQARLAVRRPEERFADLDAAVAMARATLSLTPDDRRHDERIRSFLEGRLTPQGDGSLAGSFSPQSAIVWWDKA